MTRPAHFLSFLTILLLPTLLLVSKSEAKSATGKKGVCMTTNNKKNWAPRVSRLNPDWFYSWGARLDQAPPRNVEFVPMIWGYWGNSTGFQNTIKRLTEARQAGRTTHLLGFNEPDRKSQANMSVEKAIKAWPHLQKTGLRLGSPATVHPDNEWMKQFMQQAKKKKLRVDYITLHWYGGANADSLITRLKQIHKLYGKPIWITEFAVADWDAKDIKKNKHSPQKIQKFMQEVLPRLDKLPYVKRYAWFSIGQNHAALGNSALFKEDGSLTPLGKIYAAHKSR